VGRRAGECAGSAHTVSPGLIDRPPVDESPLAAARHVIWQLPTEAELQGAGYVESVEPLIRVLVGADTVVSFASRATRAAGPSQPQGAPAPEFTSRPVVSSVWGEETLPPGKARQTIPGSSSAGTVGTRVYPSKALERSDVEAGRERDNVADPGGGMLDADVAEHPAGFRVGAGVPAKEIDHPQQASRHVRREPVRAT
jgi:hypothetical protein